MGLYTTFAQVWYPDETDTAEFNTLLATLASSIENGLQPRLAKQELAIGLKAGLTGTVSLTASATAPVSVTANNACFAQGLTISSGVITVATPGMYLVSGAVGIQNISGHTAKIWIQKNSTTLASDEQVSSASFYQVAKAVSVANCVAGDTIKMLIGDAVGSGATTASNLDMTHLSVAMIQAV